MNSSAGPSVERHSSASNALSPWFLWGLGALFYSYGMFQRVAPGAMVSELMQEFAGTAMVLGNLSAFFFYAYAGMQIPVGMLVDWWGPRKLLTAAALLCATGGLVFASAETLSTAYAGRFLLGAGAAAGWLSTLQLATTWLPRERFALVAGLTIALGIVGGVAAQAPLAVVVGNVGWRSPMLWASAFCLMLGAAIWLFARDGHNDRIAPAGEPGSAWRAFPSKLWDAITTVNTWLIIIAAGTVAGPMLAFAGLWGVPYMMENYQLSRETAATAPSAVLLGVGAGGPLFGWFSDRMGHRKPAILTAIFLALITWIILLFGRGMPLPLIFVVLFVGGMSNGAVVLTFALVRDQNDPAIVGTMSGLVNGGVMISGAIYQLLVGWLLDMQWSGAISEGVRIYNADQFRMAFSTFPIIMVLGLVAMLRVKERVA